MSIDLKIEGMGSVQMKLYDGMIRTFHNVRFVSNARVNLIPLGEMNRSGHRYVGSGRWFKVYQGNRLVFQGRKEYNNICYFNGQVVRSHKIETKKFRKKGPIL